MFVLCIEWVIEKHSLLISTSNHPTPLVAADRGTHGGERTRSQVAVAAGGHPDAGELARSLNGRDHIDATEWAPAMARLLEISL